MLIIDGIISTPVNAIIHNLWQIFFTSFNLHEIRYLKPQNGTTIYHRAINRKLLKNSNTKSHIIIRSINLIISFSANIHNKNKTIGRKNNTKFPIFFASGGAHSDINES